MTRGILEPELNTGGRLSGGRRIRHGEDQLVPDMPLVTVITAVFNGRDCLPDCVESVLAQDYPNVEYIIVDGGSADGTLDILREYDNRLSLWVSEPDRGVYDAWNKGLNLARGEWIAFLGADDMYLPGAVSAYMELARNNPTAQFLSSRARLYHTSGYSPVFGAAWEWPRSATAMSSIHVGAMHHRKLFVRYGTFDISYKIAGDYHFLLRARQHLQVAFSPKITVRIGAGGLSDSTAGLYEARRAKVETGVRSPVRASAELQWKILKFQARRMALKVRAACQRLS
jgi:glycosyltransferase involved in cell wall biosynthesis